MLSALSLESILWVNISEALLPRLLSDPEELIVPLELFFEFELDDEDVVVAELSLKIESRFALLIVCESLSLDDLEMFEFVFFNNECLDVELKDLKKYEMSQFHDFFSIAKLNYLESS